MCHPAKTFDNFYYCFRPSINVSATVQARPDLKLIHQSLHRLIQSSVFLEMFQKKNHGRITLSLCRVIRKQASVRKRDSAC